MDIYINIPNLLVGILIGFLPTFFIMYFHLKNSDKKNEYNALAHKKDIDSIENLKKQIENGYREKIEFLEGEIKNQLSIRADDVKNHKEEISTLKEAHAEDLKVVMDELSISMWKYEEDIVEKGFFSDSRLVEIGYLFQLHVKGIPCFNPQRVPVHRLNKKEASMEKIKSAIAEVINLLNEYSKKHPAISMVDILKNTKK